MRTVVGVTGASGAAYAYTLLRNLEGEIDLVVSRDAQDVIRTELGREPKDLEALAARSFRNDDLAAPPASGSTPFDAVVIVPCSGTTVAKIAAGIADNLITRVAAVALKEGRTLVLVPRETPLSPIMLENLTRLARAGATILPAMPGFYNPPKSVQDLVDFVVARILDQLGQKHDLVPPWQKPVTAAKAAGKADAVDRMNRALDAAKRARDAGMEVGEVRELLKEARAAFEAQNWSEAVRISDAILGRLARPP